MTCILCLTVDRGKKVNWMFENISNRWAQRQRGGGCSRLIMVSLSGGEDGESSIGALAFKWQHEEEEGPSIVQVDVKRGEDKCAGK